MTAKQMKAIAEMYRGVNYYSLSPRERTIVDILIDSKYLWIGNNVMIQDCLQLCYASKRSKKNRS